MTDAAEQLPTLKNPLSSSFYYRGDTKLVRAGENAQAVVAIVDIYRHHGMEARAAVRNMLDQALDAVDPALFEDDEQLSSDLQLGAKRAAIREFEIETMLSPNVTQPKFNLTAGIARDNLRWKMNANYSVSIFDHGQPLIHGGFRDEDYDDEWHMYWDGDDEPSEAEKYHHPRLGYLIGDKETLTGAVGRDAIAALFTVVESRQQYHKGVLTQFHADMDRRTRGYGEKYFNLLTLGTVPYTEFIATLGSLASTQSAEE